MATNPDTNDFYHNTHHLLPHNRGRYSKFSSLLIAVALLIFLSCDGVVLQGVLSVRGNMPHTQLVLAADDGTHYALAGPLAKDLHQHQYRKVTVRGKLISRAAGPGFPASFEVTKILSTDSP